MVNILNMTFTWPKVYDGHCVVYASHQCTRI